MKAIRASMVLLLLAGCHGDKSGNSAVAQTAEGPHVIHLFPAATEARLFVDTGRTDAHFHPVLTPKDGHALTAGQRKILESALVWNDNYGKEDVAACFMPHHFFRYFDAQHRKVGEIAVCFCCGGVEVDKGDGTAIYPETRLNAHYDRLKALIHGMGERTDIECSPGDLD
ncbi:hypothetical protein HZF05_20165 [Sphingomonas sp. CGMCC 1.13654]|uniref:Uncharacterized protein n=1 Tax=Sphingomonas chungangi TaxID=2683589 RepID=A0A838LB16_9SPHN|nr:hypothetical protein [Sphingomonas chungangi]MBA2936404.1 hypothetical protein [Sphingomonas chungangi]MVW55789.1 hypothetical protein [Sphingomonas chungangi]